MKWIRLFDGRLWHAAAADGVTFCGRPSTGDEAHPSETLQTAPPTNAWACGRCVLRLAQDAQLAREAWLLDPRRKPSDQLELSADE